MQLQSFYQRNFYTGLLVFLSCILQSSYSLAQDDSVDIHIDKTNQVLTVQRGDTVIKSYRVATGKGGHGTKRIIGDKKTPIGVYKIIDFKDDSKFHYFMQLDYPNLLDAWYGYKNKVISASEFKKISMAYKNDGKPPQDTRLGGYIGIHGIGVENTQKLQIHEDINWTDGCIALTNEQVNELKKYVGIGTKVIIKE